jgi:hypothetical protein
MARLGPLTRLKPLVNTSAFPLVIRQFFGMCLIILQLQKKLQDAINVGWTGASLGAVITAWRGLPGLN